MPWKWGVQPLRNQSSFSAVVHSTFTAHFGCFSIERPQLVLPVFSLPLCLTMKLGVFAAACFPWEGTTWRASACPHLHGQGYAHLLLSVRFAAHRKTWCQICQHQTEGKGSAGRRAGALNESTQRVTSVGQPAQEDSSFWGCQGNG